MSETAGHDFGHLTPAAAGLGHVFARPKILAALCVIVLASLGWFYVALLVAGTGNALGGFGASVLQTLCGPLGDASWSMGAVVIVTSMWGAMMLAMMLPSAAPMIMTYAGIADTAARKKEHIIAIRARGRVCGGVVRILGHCSVDPDPADASRVARRHHDFGERIVFRRNIHRRRALSVLRSDMLVQPLQQPFPFFFTNWATTARGVFRLGLKQGVYCLGCVGQ